MLSGITRARATFSCFLARMKDTDSVVEDRSSVKNDLGGCSNTTAVLHEYFGPTAIVCDCYTGECFAGGCGGGFGVGWSCGRYESDPGAALWSAAPGME
jgi:hypothetical protein